MSSSELMYRSHSDNEFGRVSLLKDHLHDVAYRAAEYAAAFNASDEARVAGLLHDLGKYGDLFQRRLQGAERGIDHWSAGAWEALTRYKAKGIAVALAVQGHHIGLLEASKDSLSLLNPQKLQQHHPLGLRLSEPSLDQLVSRLELDHMSLPDLGAVPNSLYAGLDAKAAAAMMDVRMLYSALVDADFIETEAHFEGGPDRTKGYRREGPTLDPGRILSHIRSYLDKLAHESKAAPHVKGLRADLLGQCLEAATLPQGLFTLTAPTGAGKTLAMLAFALKHATTHIEHRGLRRIVVVIPYLSIIEQTVVEYRKALSEALRGGEPLEQFILEDHSLAGIREKRNDGSGEDQDMEDDPRRQARQLAQNWDAPIIITTSVQMLESLFSNRPATCRKLHRLARSVILFDEVQTLPTSLAIPTLATLSHLAERYGTTVVFATATQPAFSHLDNHVRTYCISGWQPREIAPPSLKLFDRAKRTDVLWPDPDAPTSWVELVESLADCKQVLCVVNLKRHALQIFDALEAKGVKGVFHLSTNMCPSHRQAVLRTVRGCLEQKAPCLLVSTQCVEAGVDLDFPAVFRALGPLDSIAQAAGRCNRNGLATSGTVRVFVPEEEAYPDGAYRQAAGVTRILLKRRGAAKMDIHDPNLFREYYRELYDFVRPENRKPELIEALKRQDFAEVAQLYRVIAQDAINVLVPYDPATFRALEEEVSKTGLHGEWIAKAHSHAVSLFRPKPGDPIASFLVPVPVGRRGNSEEWFIYQKAEHYDAHRGLVPPASMQPLIVG